MFCKFLHRLFKRTEPMPVDFAGMLAKIEKLSAAFALMLADSATAVANAEKVAALEADLAAAQAGEADAEAKLQAILDTLPVA